MIEMHDTYHCSGGNTTKRAKPMRVQAHSCVGALFNRPKIRPEFSCDSRALAILLVGCALCLIYYFEIDHW